MQNQPDFQAGSVDHRTHFASSVPSLVRQAMSEYSELTGRHYAPVLTYDCDDADVVMIGLGSVGDDVRAVLPYLRGQGLKAGLVSVKLLQPFPEAEVVAALAGKKAVMVLERSDQTALTAAVTAALFRARENAVEPRHEGIPPLADTPRLTTAIFGLGGHDLQPRHLIAAFMELDAGTLPPLIYLGSQFFEDHPSEHGAEVQQRLRAAYPETELMALRTEPNPVLLPPGAMRIRFHSVGGYGTIATGKLLTDILAGLLGMHSKSAPKYGSEKSGAPTNYYITLSPEPIWLTNAELEDVEVVIAPDHKAFIHTNPLKGLVHGGTFMLQTSLSPEEVWRELPRHARKAIREREINFFTIDAFKVARKHAPTPDLETRMMGIAFIGAVTAYVDRVAAGAPREEILERVRHQLEKKFGRKGENVVEGNMAVIIDGIEATRRVDYDAPELVEIGEERSATPLLTVALSASMCPSTTAEHTSGLFDPAYYEDLMMRPFREGTIAEAPVLPGVGLFMPPGTGAAKDKGLFRREVPQFHPDVCTGCMDCALVCPDAAIPNTVHEVHDLLLTAVGRIEATPGQKDGLRQAVYGIAERTREVAAAQGRAAVPRGGRVRGSRAARRPGDVARRRPPGRRARHLPGRAHPAVLRLAGEGAAGHRWPLRGHRRPVEVHGLPRVHRRLRAGRAHRARAGRRRARGPAADLRLHERHPEHADPVHRGLGHPGRRHQAAHARPRQLLRDHRRPRRLPRLR